MEPIVELSAAERGKRLMLLRDEYDDFKARGLRLDMSRGKPCAEQLSLSNEMFANITDADLFDAAGTDCRNYGLLSGTAEMRGIFAKLGGIEPNDVIVGGNSSLQLMFDTLGRAMNVGLADSRQPWKTLKRVKFLCPSPGYDRHFGICEYYGIEMIPVKLTGRGPDMDEVERLVSDPDVRGIWCVPTYSNPTGETYSDETVRRLANMRCAAADFTIMWDNAYCVHDLYERGERVGNILSACRDAGCPQRPVIFMSTSKITFAGSGVACIAGSDKTRENVLSAMKYQTIGYDKINQLLHARFFARHSVEEQMRRQAQLLRPKFETVLAVFDEKLGGRGIAEWTRPLGGYFISYDGPENCAKKTVAMCAEAGVKLTAAGASFPYGRDPRDSNIRIAPSFPPLGELRTAAQLLCVASEICYLENTARD